MKLNKGSFLSGTANFSLFIFKTNVTKKVTKVTKKILLDLHMQRLILFKMTCVCPLLQLNSKMPIIKVFEIFQYFANNQK